ncbi:hypothetical protein RSOLAG1IB_08660 [Rhizoctonia solani AG-1 IB]|uniref:Uncharacterized protein n=1 Tax=Thanatephorus cucumeris (strain AG1-IB / isolate 7/3/14) TaxID=1108050 RepID=A0A0B7FNW8_THACB|nr:hypothetical protein RSOLAG1IB_08660 [Rhizoctonia solani AG-1 IB]
MSGAVEGPFAPTNSFLAPAPTSGMTSSRPPLSSRPVKPATSSEVVDLRLELNTPRISGEMGSRLLVSYIELLLYLKGQVPFPPSQLRRMVAGGRKGNPHQNKLLKSLSTLSEDLPSTLSSYGPSTTITIAVVFGLGREKCFLQLSGTELEQITVDGDATELEDQPPKQENRHDMASSSNENLKFNTVPVRRRGSPRLPLQELSPVETLSSQLSSVSLRPSVDEAMIRQAERALSQIMACSEIEFKGDLQPMGAQIFMRAPRRFKHESWAVRPEAARMLDAPFKALNELDVPIVETVRVCAKDAPTTVDEVEEMIWWGWDGRLAGYA